LKLEPPTPEESDPELEAVEAIEEAPTDEPKPRRRRKPGPEETN
jgi:hypothetical protein